jgi:transcriptional regulator with XRE-family HTH domain
MITHEEVGKRIRLAREELGISQGQLGTRLSRQRSHAAISDIERGKTKLDVEDLSEFARVLGRELSYFYETRPSPATVYRRGDQFLSDQDKQHTDKAISEFIAHAQSLAAKQARNK